MTWTPMPSTATQAGGDAAVRVTVNRPAGKFRQAMRVLIKPRLLSDASCCWQSVRQVTVLIGSGEHAGMLKIVHGGQWKIAAVGSRSDSLSLRLTLPLPAGVSAPDGLEAVPVKFDYRDDWIELTLPPALRTPIVPLRDDAAAAPKANGRAFSMTDHVPDPVAVLQKQRGGRVR